MNRSIPQHMVYYAPECEHCQALIERLQQSHVAFSFNAFDVTLATPPPYVKYVPTIVVFGTALVGKDAFAWVDRVQGSDASTGASTHVDPQDAPIGLQSASDQDDGLTDRPGPFSSAPEDPVIVSTEVPIDSRMPDPVQEDKIKEGSIDLDELKRQRETELPKLRPVPMPDPQVVSSTS